MPVNPKLMRALKARYGDREGESAYFAMENEGHPSTKPKAIRRAKARRQGQARQGTAPRAAREARPAEGQPMARRTEKIRPKSESLTEDQQRLYDAMLEQVERPPRDGRSSHGHSITRRRLYRPKGY
jgi:hypothetical protein